MASEKCKAQKIAEGLTYLLSFGSVYTCAEHDEFYAGLDDDSAHTPEIVAHMKSLGWREGSSGTPGFVIFT